MGNSWVHKKTISDGEVYEINGLNIWEYEWKPTYTYFNAKDPLYGQAYSISIFEIQKDGHKVSFGAIEFSNCVWGIYEEQ